MTAGGRSAALLVVALAGLLATPGAFAARVVGTLTVEGAMTLPAGVEGSAEPFGFLLNRADDLARFTLESPLIRLCEWEAPYLEAGVTSPIVRTPAPLMNTSACYPLRSAKMSLLSDGDHSGWVGLRAPPGGTIGFTASSESDLEPRPNTTLASVGFRVASSEDMPSLPWFSYHIETANALHSASGVFTYQGPASLKFLGPDVHISSTDNETDHKTGETPSGAGQRTFRWRTIEFSEGTLTVETPALLTVAAKKVDALSWDGKATLMPLSGILETRGTIYEAQGRRAELDGNFTASLSPVQGRAEIILEGDLRSTTLAATTRAPAPGINSGSAWLLWLLLGAVLAGGGAAVAAMAAHRRHKVPLLLSGDDSPEVPLPPPPRAVDDLAELEDRLRLSTLVEAAKTPDPNMGPEAAAAFIEAAELAEAKQMWDAAYLLMRAARVGSPGSSDLAMKEGQYLFFLGEYRRAYGAFEEAAYLRKGSGEPNLWAAASLARFGMYDAAERHIEEGLERQPDLLPDIERSVHFRPLHGRIRYEAALALARSRYRPSTGRNDYGPRP